MKKKTIKKFNEKNMINKIKNMNKNRTNKK